jgi:hypothetical protein
MEQPILGWPKSPAVSIVQESQGFRGVSFLRVGDDQMMAVWLWDSAADWDAAPAQVGPWLQTHAIPNLAPPARSSSAPTSDFIPSRSCDAGRKQPSISANGTGITLANVR